MSINFADPAVQAAVISSVGSILAAAIAAICASVIGFQIAGRRRLQENLRHAIDDISFLLEVEKIHCQLRAEHQGSSMKIIVRKRAAEAGERWSGKFTPGRSAARDVALRTES
jgi:GTP cyclohydrolase I